MKRFTKIEKRIMQNIKKQQHLEQYDDLVNLNPKYTIIKQKLPACLHIVQDEMGSAFIISEKGHILTCEHCVFDEDLNQYKSTMNFVFSNGDVVRANLLVQSKKLDCALLKIDSKVENYEFFKIKQETQKDLNIRLQPIFCIGQPGYDDLESKQSKKTNYKPFHVSKGAIKGYLKDKIYIDNKSQLGPLIHNCWTYWGHSGAPIFDLNGEIVGMHNSWDDSNGNRHGMSNLSILKFLEEQNLTLT